MNKSQVIIRSICCLVCVFGLLVSGCDDSSAPPPKSKVIRKKIVRRPPPPERPPADTAEAERQAEADSGQSPEAPSQKKATAETEEKAVARTDAVTSSEDKGVAERAAADTGKAPTGDGDAEEKIITSVSDRGTDKETRLVYSAVGKVDPFAPLFRDEPKVEKAKTDAKKVAKGPQKPVRRLTPLEKLDLSQLKLVGIIRTKSGNKAMVEEASGKGYIITKGTYIGIHSGRVVNILRDRIVVEEKQPDSPDDEPVRKRELKFQRPPGDEIL